MKSAQRLGFSLDEIAGLLRLEDGTHCDEASRLAEHLARGTTATMTGGSPSTFSGRVARPLPPRLLGSPPSIH